MKSYICKIKIQFALVPYEHIFMKLTMSEYTADLLISIIHYQWRFATMWYEAIFDTVPNVCFNQIIHIYI